MLCWYVFVNVIIMVCSCWSTSLAEWLNKCLRRWFKNGAGLICFEGVIDWLMPSDSGGNCRNLSCISLKVDLSYALKCFFFFYCIACLLECSHQDTFGLRYEKVNLGSWIDLELDTHTYTHNLLVTSHSAPPSSSSPSLPVCFLFPFRRLYPCSKSCVPRVDWRGCRPYE